MPVTFAIEKIDDVLIEGKHILEILKEHWREIDSDREGSGFDPDIDSYRALEKAGVAKLMVAREDGKAIGYCITFVSNSHQYKGMKIAQGDTYFVMPERRGLFAGLLMLTEMLKYLTSLGIHKVRFFSSDKCDTTPLLKRLGFRYAGSIYEKSL